MAKDPPASGGDIGALALILGWEDPLEEGMATPLPYSCLENPMDSGAWRATVHGVTKSQTQLKRLSTSLVRSPVCSHNSPSCGFIMSRVILQSRGYVSLSSSLFF